MERPVLRAPVEPFRRRWAPRVVHPAWLVNGHRDKQERQPVFLLHLLRLPLVPLHPLPLPPPPRLRHPPPPRLVGVTCVMMMPMSTHHHPRLSP